MARRLGQCCYAPRTSFSRHFSSLEVEPLESRQLLAVLAPSTFEIDGNVAVNSGGIDWNSVSASPNFASKTDLVKNTNDDALGQGSSENDTDITVVTGSIPNSKADLSRSLFYSEVVNNQVFLHLGWTRATTGGTVNFDFEINQEETAFPSGSFKAVDVALERTVGDLLITYDFDGGNNTTTLAYRTWNGSAWSGSTALGSFAIAAVSSDTLFGEASVNLTAAGILPTDPNDPNFKLEAFSQAWVRSRASTSFTSEIKDIIAPIHVNITNALTIQGTKFNDVDGNGVKGANEAVLPGWTIFLDTNGNGSLDSGETSVVTDSNGHYDFGLKAPGSYKIAEVLQSGWEETYPNGSTSGAVLTTAGTYEWSFTGSAMDQIVRDFGNRLQQKTTQFGGLKFIDTNGNGTQQSGELGEGNWTIQLWNDVDGNGSLNTTIDTLRSSTTTSSASATLGQYRFSVDTTFGSTDKFLIHEVQKAGYVQTVPTADYAVMVSWTSGNNPTVTSNPLGLTGDSLGQVAPFNLDFGNFLTDARIQLAPSSSTNPVGQNHTITATVQQNLGSGFVSAPNGTVVVFSLTNSNGATATFVSDGVDSDGDGNSGNDAVVNNGVCSVQIVSATAGTVTINGYTTFTVAGRSLSRDTDPNTAATSGPGGTGPVTKTYVDASIALSPLTATNSTTEPHTITAAVKQNLGTGGGFVNAPNGTIVVFSLANNSGATASFVSDGVDSNGDGNSGNDAVVNNGTASVQIVSATAGTVTINATTTFTVGGVSLTRDTNPATTSIPAGPNGTGPATKTYVAPNLVVTKTPDAATVHLTRNTTNYAGFTITVRNTGAGTAFNVLLDDDLPDPDAQLTWYISDANNNPISVPGSSITQDQTNSFGTGDYLHSIVGNLAGDPDGAGPLLGGSFTIHVSAVVPLTYLNSGSNGTIGDTFEIDGDKDPNHGGIDWNSPSVTSSPQYGTKSDLSKSVNDDALGQGSSENDTQITVVTGSIPNSKADLTKSLFYSETIRDAVTLKDEVVLHLGWERATTSGTVNFDFEINQVETTFPTPPFKSVKVNLIRTVGDLLITYDFNGNNVALNLRTWNGTAWGSPMSLGGVATAAVSPNGLFGEASINLTDAGILLTDPSDPNYKLEAFSQAWVRSRASSSFTSEIKDIIAPAHVNINNAKTVTLNNTAYAFADNHPQVSGSASIDITNIPATTSSSGFVAAATSSSLSTKSTSLTTQSSTTTKASPTSASSTSMAVHDLVFGGLKGKDLGRELHNVLTLLAQSRRRN